MNTNVLYLKIHVLIITTFTKKKERDSLLCKNDNN